MQEHTVTSGTTTIELEPPFLVMATQNPIEMEGTYPLPEAQLDRFLMKILVQYPTRAELGTIVERTIQKDEIAARAGAHSRRDSGACVTSCHQVLVAPHVQDHAINLVMATQPGRRGRTSCPTNTSATEARRAARRRWWNADACSR